MSWYGGWIKAKLDNYVILYSVQSLRYVSPVALIFTLIINLLLWG